MRPIVPVERREVTRQGNPGGGGERQQVQTELLVVNAASGTFVQTTFSFDVIIPSSRLACLVAVTFVPDATEDTPFPASGATAWYVQMDAWVQLGREQGGSWTRANQIIPKTPLPTSQEVSTTLVRKWRGTVTVPALPGAGLFPGKLYVTGIWEPAPGESTISDEELQQLFAVARVNIQNGGTVSVTGVGGG